MVEMVRAEHNNAHDATRRVSASCSHVEGFDRRSDISCLSPSTTMSFAGYDEGDAWGAPAPATSGDIVADAMRKEKIIKYVLSQHSPILAIANRV